VTGGSLSGLVNTVLGPVHPERLGLTLPHEHVFCSLEVFLEAPRDEDEARFLEDPISEDTLPRVRRQYYRSRPNTVLDDEELAVRELERFTRCGGATVVDQSPPAIGRDLDGLVRVAGLTGLHIVAGCGFYVEQSHPREVADHSAEELAEQLVAELRSDPAGTRPSPGIIGEIGLSSPMTVAERKVLLASGLAHLATGAPLSVHTRAPDGLAALDLLEAAGVDPARVAIAHTDAVIDRGYQLALAARGAFVECDYFGWSDAAEPADEVVAGDDERVAGVAALLEAGFGDQVLLSQDVALRIQLAEYGGGGYAHIVRDLPPLFAAHGIGGRELRRLMTANPARWLAWA